MTDKKLPNPFTPDFGMVPVHLAGRQNIIDRTLHAFETPIRDPFLTSIFIGARGTGKTALLSYLGKEAQSRGWITVDVTAEDGMLEDIVQQTIAASSHLIDRKSGKRLTGIEIASFGSISWETDEDSSPNWRTKMNVLIDSLEEHGNGLLITVDEVDPSIDEMVKLATTYQHFVREGRRVGLLMAGLPHNVSSLITGKSTSFLRRASQFSLGSITDQDVAFALERTLLDSGRKIAPDALDKAVNVIQGFPFMIQLLGYALWNTSTSETFSIEHVGKAAELAEADLRHRVLDATLRELSDADVDFLCAMLPDEGPSSTTDIAKRTGKSSAHISTYKKRLLEAGVIEETVRHKLYFSLPGFRAYLSDLRANGTV